MQIYYNKEGKLKFKHIPSREIIPFWADSEHTKLDALIRIYEEEEYLIDSIEKRLWERIDYYTPEGVWKYRRLKAGGNIVALSPIEGEGHFKVVKDNQEIEANWNKVPFVAFKYNRNEVSLINWIKPLIDDYDTNCSDASNNLQDIPNSIKVIKGYEDSDKEEFSKNLNTFRNVFVGEGGDVTALETPTNIDEVDLHLTRVRKDIFEFGGGVDTVNKELRDVSGVALRFQYADLDMDCSEMSQQYKYSLRQLQWFINEDLKSKGVQFDDSSSNFLFNTAVIINETETINNLAISKDMISEKSLLEHHPWVKNVEQEIQEIEKDRQEQMQKDLELAEKTAQIEKKYEATHHHSTTN
jgi:SPP1 family phage portal protein